MGKGTTESGGNLYYAKGKGLKYGENEPFPQIELMQKKGDRYEITDTVSYLTGFITGIEIVDKNHEQYGRMRGFKLTIQDPDDNETYVLDMLYSGAARELLNRMVSLESFEEKVRIAFYRNNGHAGGSLKRITLMGDVKVEIKYPWDSVNKRIKIVKFKGKDQKDYDEVDDFFDNVITKILSEFRKPTFTKNTVTTPSTPDPSPEHTDNQDIPDDLPF